MRATFFRFVVALLIWISFPLVIVAALAPEESTEFDGQKVTDFGLQARDERMLDVRDFRGGPVIVEFFASGSSACRAQAGRAPDGSRPRLPRRDDWPGAAHPWR